MCDDVGMDDLVQIYSTPDAVNGELMRGRLEAEGVEVLMKGGEGGPYPTGPVYLFVTAEDETRARGIVDAVESGAFSDAADDAFSADQTSADPPNASQPS